MKTLVHLYTLLVFFGLTLALDAQVVYVATGSNGTAGSLYQFQINGTTGTQLSSVPITNASGGGAIGITGLAFNPLNGVLYGVSVRDVNGGNTVSASLVTINPDTGVANVIGSLGVAIGDIAFASNGALYGWEAKSPTSLATINLSTGGITTVGSSGSTNTTGGGLAINPTNGTAYVSFTGAAPSPPPSPPAVTRGTLDTVNLSTGTVTKGATITGAPNDFGGLQGNGSINALAFTSSGVLYGANSDQALSANVDLIIINLVNGAVNDLFLLPQNTDAIAFNPTAVPEPSTIGLIVFGAVGTTAIWFYRRRR